MKHKQLNILSRIVPQRTTRVSPGTLKILLPIVRHVTTLFPDPVDDMRLGHEVPLPERQQPLQLVGQQFTADVDSEDIIERERGDQAAINLSFRQA